MVAIVKTPSFAVFTVAVPLAEVLDSADFLSLLLPHPANMDTDITTASATAANFFIFIFLSPLFHFITSFSKKICVLQESYAKLSSKYKKYHKPNKNTSASCIFFE